MQRGWPGQRAGRPQIAIQPNRRGELERVAADLLRAEGAPSQIVGAQLNNAISTARSQGARLFELRAATSLPSSGVTRVELTEAHALLAPLYRWFTEGFNTPDLQEAKALLDELGDPC
jgi:predicted ATPase